MFAKIQHRLAFLIPKCVTVDKEKKEAIRESALMKHHEKLCAESRSKAATKQAEKKYALESMMKVRLADTQSVYIVFVSLLLNRT